MSSIARVASRNGFAARATTDEGGAGGGARRLNSWCRFFVRPVYAARVMSRDARRAVAI
jgi:hypothetical protein